MCRAVGVSAVNEVRAFLSLMRKARRPRRAASSGSREPSCQRAEGWKPPVPPARPPPSGLWPNGAPSESHPHPHLETGGQTTQPGETPAEVGVRHSIAAGPRRSLLRNGKTPGHTWGRSGNGDAPAASLTCSGQRPRGDPGSGAATLHSLQPQQRTRGFRPGAPTPPGASARPRDALGGEGGVCA